MIQTSCSELLVDTAIYEPEEAYDKFSAMFKKLKWESSPALSVELLAQLKEESEKKEDEDGNGGGNPPPILVFDAKGNRAHLKYGANRYSEDLGYRFDSECNQYDDKCFPIFDAAIEMLGGELKTFDGGNTDHFERWKEKKK